MSTSRSPKFEKPVLADSISVAAMELTYDVFPADSIKTRLQNCMGLEFGLRPSCLGPRPSSYAIRAIFPPAAINVYHSVGHDSVSTQKQVRPPRCGSVPPVWPICVD